MSAFTQAEIDYLRAQTLARIATGRPRRAARDSRDVLVQRGEDTIDVGGTSFGEGKKWRDA